MLGEGERVTTHSQSYSCYKLSLCIPVTPVTAAAFGIVAVEMPVRPLSGGIVWARRVCVSVTGNKIVFCLAVGSANTMPATTANRRISGYICSDFTVTIAHIIPCYCCLTNGAMTGN